MRTMINSKVLTVGVMMVKFCWHNWTGWETYWRYTKVIVGFGREKSQSEERMRRMCLKCGKKQDVKREGRWGL